MEELRETIRSQLERSPGWHSLPELLVDNDHDGHDVRQGAGLLGEVWPEKVLQELRELQHHDPLDAEVAALDVVGVDLLHHLDTEWLMSMFLT